MNNVNSFILQENLTYYKLKISKKSGLPDNDLPCKTLDYLGIEANLKIKECNLRSFSVSIEENMKIKPNQSMKNESMIKIDSINNNENYVDILNNKSVLLPNNQNKKKCCYCLIF